MGILSRTLLYLICFVPSSIKKAFLLILRVAELMQRQVAFLYNEGLHFIQLSPLNAPYMSGAILDIANTVWNKTDQTYGG